MNARTIQYQPAGGVELTSVDVCQPGPGQVQVQATACGICAWDIHVYKHGSDWDVMPGHEGVGRVVNVGPGVEHLVPGTRVTGHGLGFTELVNLPAEQLMALPDDGRADEHWIVEPVSCVVTGLDHCAARAGDRVAVVGCGFMGLMMIQALAGSPLDRLIAMDLDGDRRALAEQFGADEVHDAAAEDGLIERLHSEQIDTVIDTTGSEKGLHLASRIVRPGGTLNLFGWNHGSATFPGDLWHMHGITVINSTPAAAVRDPFVPAIRLIDRGIVNLEPLVTHVGGIEDYPELLRIAAEKSDGYIKGVVRLG